MGLELLRKHIQELKERGILGSGYETPEMNTYQPASPSPVEPYNPPEVAVPISTNTQAPKTTPVSAVKPVVPTASTSNNAAKADPKSGQNGLKAFTDITSKSPQFGEAGIGNTDLIDAYNAGLNGTDLSRETRDNAAAGGYLDSIEAMFNAGLQDASLSKNVDDFDQENVDNTKNTSYDLSTEAAREEKFSQKSVDNQVESDYTSSNTTGNTGTGTNSQNEYVPKMGADTSKQATSNSASSGEPYKITDEEKELNYMMDMLFMNGAGSSADPSVQAAYQWLMNPNKNMDDEKVYNEKLKQTKEAFYTFMSGITDDQIARSNQIAVGKKDDVGLVQNVYKEKEEIKKDSANSTDSVKSVDNSKKNSYYYPEAKPSSFPRVDLADYIEATTIKLGKAGQFTLGEIIKPDPKIIDERGVILYSAYRAGLSNHDITEEMKEVAQDGGYLDEILKMHQAGEADAKISASPWEANYGYFKKMLDSLDAGNNNDSNAQLVYQYFNNPEKERQDIPKEITDAFYNYLKGFDKNERIRAYEKATGKKLDGLCSRIELSDGSHIDEKGELIPTGPYSGCRVSQGFNDPYTRHKGHVGYDIVGDFTDIRPILDGIIVGVQSSQYYYEDGEKKTHPDGITITVQHTNSQGQVFYSTYCHLNSVGDLKIGDAVTTNSIIGEKGNTGDSDGDHLHLAVYTRDDPTSNPFGYSDKSKYIAFAGSDKYTVNGYYYPLSLERDPKHSIFYDPYLIMITNGELISLYP